MKRAVRAQRALARPRRTCLGCGARADKDQLIRLRTHGQGELMLDDNGTGRGGYLHDTPQCWEKFIRCKSLYRAFHVEIGKSLRQKLIEILKERQGE